MASLSVKNAGKVFPNGFVAVKDFGIEVKDGEFMVLAGPSGCGKSAVLCMIAGLEEITSGEIFIGGRRVNDVDIKDRDVAMVFQNCAPYPDMTVYENMAFGLKMRNLQECEIDREVRRAARILDLEQFLDCMPGTLSGSQRQRVVMGRAIVRRPSVFLMDEPLSNLDGHLRGETREELKRIQEELRVTMLYVTNDQQEAMALGSRIAVMNDGVIQQAGTPEELYERPCNKFVAGFMGVPPMNMFDAAVKRERDCVVLTFDSRQIRLTEEKSAHLLRQGYAGKRVVCGIRPENFHMMETAAAPADCGAAKAVIQMREMVGDRLFLYFQADGISFVAEAGAGIACRPGDIIYVWPDSSRLHFFDPVTERAITAW